MENTADSWTIDPTELLKPANILNNKRNAIYTPESESNMFLKNDITKNNNNNSNNITNADPLGINYYDIDNFLTQELRDLDIPMIPSDNIPQNIPFSNNNNPTDQFTLMDDNGVFNQIASIGNSNSISHKRGMSGTAIFGFANHNKTLSISSLQRSTGLDQQNNNNIFNNNNTTTNNNNIFNNDNNNPITNNNDLMGQDDEVSKLILRQQEELRVALEKQKMVNQKLQEQLRANQLQQERLQKALEEQNGTSPYRSLNTHGSNSSGKNNQLQEPRYTHTSSPSPQRSLRTPARGTSGDELIITSNSADGKYQFPPPSMISPPLSNTSLNGSPLRRGGMVSNSNSNNNNGNNRRNPNFSISTSSITSSTSPTKLSNDLHGLDGKIPELFQTSDDTESTTTTKKKTYQHIEPLNSPFFNVSSPSTKSNQHKKKESVISTVSTIPLSTCDSDNESTSPQRLIGLGITMGSDTEADNDEQEHISSRVTRRSPVKIDIMPTIPASTENTPIKQLPSSRNPHSATNTNNNNNNSGIPKKHLFQHTPVKQRPEYIVINNSTTPVLNPPITFSVLSPTNSNNTGGIYQRTILSPRYNNGEANFLLESPPMPPPVEPHVGPLKITRKPTTLPRGSIDQYVKELPDKQFECLYPNCGKTFKRRYNIRSHIQTHLEDRPYPCDYPGCDKAFVRNHDLIRHKKSHLNKMFSCPCGKKFNNEEMLIQHRNRMVCSNGKKYETIMVGKNNTSSSSSARRGSHTPSVTTATMTTTPSGSPVRKPRERSESPVKRSVETDRTGYIQSKLQAQLSLQQSEQDLDGDYMISALSPSGFNDLEL